MLNYQEPDGYKWSKLVWVDDLGVFTDQIVNPFGAIVPFAFGFDPTGMVEADELKMIYGRMVAFIDSMLYDHPDATQVYSGTPVVTFCISRGGENEDFTAHMEYVWAQICFQSMMP